MKKLITLIAVLIGLQSVAQNIPPQAINFQGVAIDKNGIPVPGMDELGNPIQNSAIRVRFSILTGSATGIISYQEEHLTTTDEFGRFNLEIGRGTATNGVFSAINWGGDKQFLQVEVDLSALGTNYTLASVQEFISVPYALYARTAGSTGVTTETDPIFGASVASGITAMDTANWNNDLIFDGDTTYWKVKGDSLFTNKWVGIWSLSSPTAPLTVGQGPNGDAAVRFRNGFGTSKVLHIIENQGSSGHYGLFIGSSDYTDAVLVTKGGLVGIRTTTPQRQLHVNDVMRLEPRTSAPSSPAKGDIYFDDTLNKLRVYDGLTWQNCW